ncbi:hypothetical protein VTK56DRAFT_1435 [Thermocarpiscus australiensis]
MPGPRAPIGYLSQHATAAAELVRGMVPNMFRGGQSKHGLKREEVVKKESASDSDSASSSDESGSDFDIKKEDGVPFAEKLKAKTKAKKLEAAPQSKMNGAKNIKTESPANPSPKVKLESPETKPSKDLSASESSDSESTSDSDSGTDSDNEQLEKKALKTESGSDTESKDTKMDVKQEIHSSPKAIKKAPSVSSSTGQSDSDDSDDESASPEAKQAEPATNRSSTSGNESSSEDESESESDSESEAESEEEVVQKPKVETTAKSAKAATEERRSKETPQSSKVARASKTKEPKQSSKVSKEASKAKEKPKDTKKPREEAKVKETSAAKQSASVNEAFKSKEFVSESESSSAESDGKSSDAESSNSSAAKALVSVNGTTESKESVSESESSSAESDGESSDAESSGSVAEDEPKFSALEKRNEHTIRGPREILSQGFHLRKAEEDMDAAAVTQFLKKAKAEGKQIWYFTTPKSVPIEVVQKHEIPLEKIRAGQSIFSHEGAEYTGHFEEPVNNTIKVLIPGKTGNSYETLDQPVGQVLHITRVTRFEQDGESRASSSAALPAAVSKAPRPQPKGLKARFPPIGVTNGSMGKIGVDASDSDEDVEMTQAPPLLTSSAADARADTPKKAAKKRKHGDVEKGTPGQEEAVSTPNKKSKKPRVDSSNAAAVQTSVAKATKHTPVAPPPVPSSMNMTNSSQTAASPELGHSSPVKKSKGKDKGKKKESASTESKQKDVKPPAKVTPVLPPAIPGLKST